MGDVEDIVQALVVRPGDTLILRIRDQGVPTPAYIEQLREQIEQRLPGVTALLVFGVDDLAVYRED